MGIKMIMKSIGKAVILPILINDIFIPMTVLFVRLHGTSYNTHQTICILTQMFTPFFAAYWILLDFTKYIDIKGNEVFFLKNRNKSSEAVWLYLLYMLSNLPVWLWYICLDTELFFEYIHIAIISFLFVSLAYFFCFLLKGISLAIIPLFIYEMISVCGLNKIVNKLSFFEEEGARLSDIMGRYRYYLVVAILFFILGIVVNGRHDDY